VLVRCPADPGDRGGPRPDPDRREFRRSLDTVGFCWIILFAEVAGPVIPRARNLSIRMIEQNPTSERRRSRDGRDAPVIYPRLSYNPG
jgi:hypothetical protein